MNAVRMTTALPALLALAATVVFADEIILKDGKSISCESIKDATIQRVSYKKGGAAQEVPADTVERIIPSGDQSLDTALRLLQSNGDAARIETNLKRALERAEDPYKPYAQYFLGEFYQSQNKLTEAVAAFDAVATLKADHFYAPVGLYRAAEILLAQNQAAQAQQRLTRLETGFGNAWKDKAGYAKARILLATNRDQAKAAFARLASSAATPEIRHLASCGEAACELAANNADQAKRKFQAVTSAPDAPPAAKGWAWKGIGDCSRAQVDDAMLAYLRSILLYPSNPESHAAATAAGELAGAQRVDGAQRLTALGRSPFTWADFVGPQGDAELMRRTLQFVSAGLARRLAPGLAGRATGEEKAELEFIAADSLKVMAQQSNDPNMLKEYEDALKALQQKYPNHSRASMAGLDTFNAAKDRALTLISRAKEETDAAKAAQLMQEGRRLFADNLEPLKKTIAEMTKAVDAFIEKEASGEALSEEQQEQKQETEFQRDLAEFLLADAYASYASTFPEGDAGRAENYRKALEGYEHQINMRGTFPHLLNFAYVGRVDVQIELGQLDDAIANARDLTAIEPPDPSAPKELLDHIKDICIRGYYGWVRALVKAGKFQEAVQAAAGIDEARYAQGWRDHPMGILLQFERAKAQAGAGQGAAGAAELWSVIQQAMQVPDSEKIPGLGMSRIGAGACRALSELSDVSGGEIYPPAMQYHVGIGYFLRQRSDLAIAGFKGVLVSARTPAERREWVPKAVKQIGNLLFEQNRFLEAALAYETVMTEFPDHPDASDAVKFALSAARRAIDQFGENPTNKQTPICALYNRIESGAAQNDPEQLAKVAMRTAGELHERGQWAEAADNYLKVPAEIPLEGGGKRAVTIYPNAVANAGYCYFQLYKASKNQEHLGKAREQLTRAVQLARAANDVEAQSLAAFYLGELECELDRPTQSLEALAAFDRELASATRYMVRARYVQAQAYFKLNQPDAVAKAEEAFDKISSRTDDQYYARFAYYLARQLRTLASAKLKEAGDHLEEARELRRKSARYGKAFFDGSNKDTLRDAHYFWVGSVLFDGGLYADAVAVYREALTKFQRPTLDGTEDVTKLFGEFDTAELNLAYAMVLAGQAREGYDALARVRDRVDVRDRDNRLVGRATLKQRQQLGPFAIRREGRTTQQQVWFTVVDLNGAEQKFFDVAPPAAGDTEFTGVMGADPTAPWGPADQRKLSVPFKREYLVVDGMARAAWAIYEQGKDQSFLARDLSAAINELRYVLRGMGEGGFYRQLVGSSQLEPTDFNLRKWDADVQYLRLKMARELWREVASDIRQMEMLGTLAQAPQPIQQQILAIKAEAESKQ
jgi:tetratricopeptide (TPR) repeat protein